MLFCHCQCRGLSIITKMSFLETKLFIDSCDSGQRYSDTRLLFTFTRHLHPAL